MTDYDVIVIGGGHNGLIAAGYLAKSGRRVLLLEANEQPGGMASNHEIVTGYLAPECAQYVYGLPQKIVGDLSLSQFGYTLAADHLDTIALAEGSRHLVFAGDGVSGDSLSNEDRANYRAFIHQMDRFARILSRTFSQKPPRMMNNTLRDKFAWLKLGLGVRGLGKSDMQELLRIGGINIYDVVEERFSDDTLKGAICLDSVLGANAGPRSNNTVLNYLYRRAQIVSGGTGISTVRGGMGALAKALAKAARSFGVEIKTNSQVSRIDTDAEGVTGVTVAEEKFLARCVVSAVDPRATLADLVGYKDLDTDFGRRTSLIRGKGSVAKINLALRSLPEFQGLSVEQTGQRLITALNPKAIDRAFNPSKYGELPEQLLLEICLPSIHDDSLCPSGQHVMSINAQFVALALKGDTDQNRKDLLARVLRQLESYAPGISDCVIASQVALPSDLASSYRSSGGHWHHVELSVDQLLMMRPTFDTAEYRTPIRGLYLGSAGSHPGGGISGWSGFNCANEVIRGD